MGRLVALLFVACGAMPALGMLALPGPATQGEDPDAWRKAPPVVKLALALKRDAATGAVQVAARLTTMLCPVCQELAHPPYTKSLVCGTDKPGWSVALHQ